MHATTKYFSYDHLPLSLQNVSRPFGLLAKSLDGATDDGIQKDNALQRLLEAKDATVRAAIDSEYDPLPSGTMLVWEERVRQIEIEGFSQAHDSEYTENQLVEAAMHYLAKTLSGVDHGGSVALKMEDKKVVWPWDEEWFKPDNEITMLIKAAALLCAEIDRRILADELGMV